MEKALQYDKIGFREEKIVQKGVRGTYGRADSFRKNETVGAELERENRHYEHQINLSQP